MNALPQAFIEQMQDLLGSETPAFLRALEQPAALALRLNPLRPQAEAAAAEFVEGVVPWEPSGRYLKPGARPGAAIAHWAGAYYLQEASAMASAAALNAQPGERVLDLCAAPGGKSTQIAAALAGEGLLVSNDPEFARAKVLAGNLERMGAPDAVVVSALPDQLARRWGEAFDAVLVDAPCSGEGMFRREPAARAEWSPASPQGCAKRQADILDSAAAMVRPGGRLVYSTCTFNALENEGSVEGFLRRHPEFAPEEFALDGVGRSRGGMLRLLPHRLRGDGHFVARLRKAGAPKTEVRRPAKREKGAPIRPKNAGSVSLWRAALESSACALPDFIAHQRFFAQGDRLYCAPEGAPNLDGLRVISPGLALLRAGRSHVEPEHALAMALPPELALRRAELDGEAAAAYLAGEALPLGGEDGWTLVTHRGMPLGWGKHSGDTLKNHLPKGLRRLSKAPPEGDMDGMA